MGGISHYPVLMLLRMQEQRCPVSNCVDWQQCGHCSLIVISLMMKIHVIFFLRPLKRTRFVARLAYGAQRLLNSCHYYLLLPALCQVSAKPAIRLGFSSRRSLLGGKALG